MSRRASYKNHSMDGALTRLAWHSVWWVCFLIWQKWVCMVSWDLVVDFGACIFHSTFVRLFASQFFFPLFSLLLFIFSLCFSHSVRIKMLRKCWRSSINHSLFENVISIIWINIRFRMLIKNTSFVPPHLALFGGYNRFFY